MGTTVSGLDCRYQDKLTSNEVAWALNPAQFHECEVTTWELRARGELLEVCGEDFVTGERVLVAISLCRDCHRKNHLDARRQHHHCQAQARNSRWAEAAAL